MERADGMGGVFFFRDDPDGLRDRNHLEIWQPDGPDLRRCDAVGWSVVDVTIGE
jgi:hypothetical protein